MTLPIGEYLRQWIELSTTEGQRGRRPLLLRHKGRDSWDRPVYEDENGKLWKDVESRASDGPKLCSALYNAFDGEPDTPLEVMERYKDKAIVFIPKRDTWTW